MKKLLILIPMLILCSVVAFAINITWIDEDASNSSTDEYMTAIDFQATALTFTPINNSMPRQNITGIWFGWNGTGSWVNDTKIIVNSSEASATLFVTKNIEVADGRYCWIFYVNTTGGAANGLMNQTDTKCNPIYRNPTNVTWRDNSSSLSAYTKSGDFVIFNITYQTTNFHLRNLTNIGFAWNGTSGGAITNDSEPVILTDGISSTFGINKTIGVLRNEEFCWYFWSNTTTGHYNTTTTWCHELYHAPAITFWSPVASQTLTATSIIPNISVNGQDSSYRCEIFVNDSSNEMTKRGATKTLANATPTNFANITLSEGIHLINARCSDYSNAKSFIWADNITFIIDAGTPSLSVDYLIDENLASIDVNTRYIKTTNFSLNLTITDDNLDSCDLYLSNDVNGTLYLNKTEQSPASNLRLFDGVRVLNSTGVYSYYVTCNDSSGQSTTSSTYYFTIDQLAPRYNGTFNYSVGGSCTSFAINITANEVLTNSSITYGNSSYSSSYTTHINTTDSMYRIHELDLDYGWENFYVINITLTDLAGNVNNTIQVDAGQLTMRSPVPLCTGWSIYTMYDNSYDISSLKTAANASFVYLWNQTSQGWLYANTDGLSAGNAVYLYNPTDTTWFRPAIDADINHNFSMSSGHNYVGIGYGTTFGDLSTRQFRNFTGGNKTEDGLNTLIDYFAAWNNTGKNWVMAMYEATWENSTWIGRNFTTGLDAVWVWSDYNLTVQINATSGHIIANWSD